MKSHHLGHFDINKVCEELVCGLFQEIYGFSHLRNLNDEEKQNFPGIDLADDLAHIVIQVTSKQGSYSQSVVDQVTQNLFSFNVTRNVMSFSDLATKAKTIKPNSAGSQRYFSQRKTG